MPSSLKSRPRTTSSRPRESSNFEKHAGIHVERPAPLPLRSIVPSLVKNDCQRAQAFPKACDPDCAHPSAAQTCSDGILACNLSDGTGTSFISRRLKSRLINLVRQRTDRWRFNAGAPDMEEGAADIMDDEIRLKVSLLDALANPVRFRVVSHLIGHEMSISELTGKCRTTRRNVTYALTQLHRDGFVSRRFEKQTALYSCCHPGIIRLFDVTSGIIQADRKEIDLERRRSRSSRHRCAGEVEQ